jgi:hypothetical protein
MLRFLMALVVVHGIGGIALAGNWFWIRTAVVLAVWLLGIDLPTRSGRR